MLIVLQSIRNLLTQPRMAMLRLPVAAISAVAGHGLHVAFDQQPRVERVYRRIAIARADRLRNRG